MGLWDWVKNWVSDKFKENIEDIENNWNEIKKNIGNIFISLITLIAGVCVLKDYGFWNLLSYILTAIWILFFNTTVLIEKPLYFYLSLVAILVADAIKPLLTDGIKFLSEGNCLMFIVYIGVWTIIRIEFNQLKESR